MVSVSQRLAHLAWGYTNTKGSIVFVFFGGIYLPRTRMCGQGLCDPGWCPFICICRIDGDVLDANTKVYRMVLPYFPIKVETVINI